VLVRSSKPEFEPGSGHVGRMPSFGMLRSVALASIFRVTRIGELGTTLAVTNFLAVWFGGRSE
jgi:hypothetical protein